MKKECRESALRSQKLRFTQTPPAGRVDRSSLQHAELSCSPAPCSLLPCSPAPQLPAPLLPNSYKLTLHVSYQGALCEEGMQGICFKITEAQVHTDPACRKGGQIIPAARRAFLLPCSLLPAPSPLLPAPCPLLPAPLTNTVYIFQGCPV